MSVTVKKKNKLYFINFKLSPPWRILMGYLGKYKKLCILILFLMLLSSMLQLLEPIIINTFIDYLKESHLSHFWSNILNKFFNITLFSVLLFFTTLFFITTIILTLLYYFSYFFSWSLGIRIERDLRKDMFNNF
ncbi:MAG: hypothetical protein NC817_01905 [Candidatus Omnitrophica bacterium]|nr:hypothetical protein [Candidatus Omnitrophota bacterium]